MTPPTEPSPQEQAYKRVLGALQARGVSMRQDTLELVGVVTAAAVEGMVPVDEINRVQSRRDADVDRAFAQGEARTDAKIERIAAFAGLVHQVREVLTHAIAWEGPEDWRDNTIAEIDELLVFLGSTPPSP